MPCQKLRFALVWLYKLSTGWIHIRGASSSKCDGCTFKNRVHAISQILSYGLFHKTTAALGPYEPPEKVLDPPAFARLPARPLKFGPLCTGGRKSEVGILG